MLTPQCFQEAQNGEPNANKPDRIDISGQPVSASPHRCLSATTVQQIYQQCQDHIALASGRRNVATVFLRIQSKLRGSVRTLAKDTQNLVRGLVS